MFFTRTQKVSRLLQSVPQASDLQAFLDLLPENDRPSKQTLNNELQKWVNTSVYGA